MVAKDILVPIKGLQLQEPPLLRERVFVKWKDSSSDETFTLGSCSHQNKQNLNFLMTASSDLDGHVHIYFSLKVSIRQSCTRKQMEMLFVVPPDANLTDSFTPLLASGIDDLSFLDASALHQAGISKSGLVMRVEFHLTTSGFVVMNKRKKTPGSITPKDGTSSDLIERLKSLSKTKIFSVYISPSTYAQVNFKKFHANLIAAKRKSNVNEMYVQQGAMLVEWSIFGPSNRYDTLPPQDTLPPPYTKNPTTPSKEVQVPQSPPVILKDGSLSIDTIEVVIAETPTQTPVSPNLTPVMHGIFSSSVEGLFDSEPNLNDFEEDSRCNTTDFDVCSDEESLAKLNSRELSQQPTSTCDLEILNGLQAKLIEWLKGAMTQNPNVYKHKSLAGKLSLLGYYIRTSNAEGFNVTRLWCSAIFFYDPLDSIDTPESPKSYHQSNKHPVSQMFGLIEWANTFRYGAEFSSPLVNGFVKLGSAARSLIASRTQQNEEIFDNRKLVCMARILTAFGTSDIGEKKRKAVSGKERDLLELPINEVSKRARTLNER
ncbi:hypothetical protein BHYA_0077g00150 [Botrytis hyacinthi]|uniref:Uncharacterized protein n=1 Tax=Botrytis hyacinthi TaxID=278943 RepID=A0A4Z1GS91_9HELO|nr:hypothetical protein BHYA_0077g00150 [Botrytis hyacinthi]